MIKIQSQLNQRIYYGTVSMFYGFVVFVSYCGVSLCFQGNKSSGKGPSDLIVLSHCVTVHSAPSTQAPIGVCPSHSAG